RYIEFNVDKIQNVACATVGAQRCIMFKKLGEGCYNKVFSLNFDNRVEVIARLPTALAGAPFITMASEVATIEFVREVLCIYAPHIFAWSANATANPVGAEYIDRYHLPGMMVHH
ncbi:hypothetical protein JB92DRAFT_2767640, partial [Gautieria morchelliformis]